MTRLQNFNTCKNTNAHGFLFSMTVTYADAGPLPVPERWHEDLGKGILDLEETDIGSTDQVWPKRQPYWH